jgi:hypothetical protein
MALTPAKAAGLVVLAVLLRWAPVMAGPDDSAQQLFGQGVDAARQNRWNDARVAFERAYELSQRPVVLINLAGAQAKTGRLKEAATNYRRILEDDSAETAPFRKAAADVLPSLEARIPMIRLHSTGLRGADVVELDGEEVPVDHIGEPRLLDPGRHTIVVKRAGIERARVAFSLAEGESHDMSLPAALDPTLATPPALAAPLEPVEAANGSTAGLSLEERSTPVARPHRSWWRSPWFWTAVAAGAIAATVTTFAVRNQEQQTFSGNVPPGVIHVE